MDWTASAIKPGHRSLNRTSMDVRCARGSIKDPSHTKSGDVGSTHLLKLSVSPYPRSHKLDAFNMQDFGLDRRQEGPLNYAKYQDIMSASMERAGYQRKLAIIPRGHCLIWAANLVHGGPPADTQKKPRFSQVTHYFFRGASYMWAPV